MYVGVLVTRCSARTSRIRHMCICIQDHREELKNFNANYKDIIAGSRWHTCSAYFTWHAEGKYLASGCASDIDEYKPLTTIKHKLGEAMQALMNAQTEDAEELIAATKKAIAAVRQSLVTLSIVQVQFLMHSLGVIRRRCCSTRKLRRRKRGKNNSSNNEASKTLRPRNTSVKSTT